MERFVSWMKGNAIRLARLPSQEAAGQIGVEIARFDGRLGIEIPRTQEAGVRTAIITAFSDPKAFELVFGIVASLQDVAAWKFQALKPPRGFAFRITLGGQSMDAKFLHFAPIPEIKGGFRLYVSGEVPAGREAEEMAWLIVETGIGEELAGRIQHLEFGGAITATDSWPISELEYFVRRLDVTVKA